MADLSPVQIVVLKSVLDEVITSRRRSVAKSTRPEFKAVYDREIGEMTVIKTVLEEMNGKAKSGNTAR